MQSMLSVLQINEIMHLAILLVWCVEGIKCLVSVPHEAWKVDQENMVACVKVLKQTTYFCRLPWSRLLHAYSPDGRRILGWCWCTLCHPGNSQSLHSPHTFASTLETGDWKWYQELIYIDTKIHATNQNSSKKWK